MWGAGHPGLRSAPPRAIDVGPCGAAGRYGKTMPEAWTRTARGGEKRNPGKRGAPPASRPNGADVGVVGLPYHVIGPSTPGLTITGFLGIAPRFCCGVRLSALITLLKNRAEGSSTRSFVTGSMCVRPKLAV